MSNGGAVSAPVGDSEKLAAVRAFAQEFFDGLQEEPLGERNLSGAACTFTAEGCDDDFLGGAGEGGERQGFEFGGGLGAAEEGFYSADFVEVGHARGGVSKGIHHGGHGEHGGRDRHRGGELFKEAQHAFPTCAGQNGGRVNSALSGRAFKSAPPQPPTI